MRTGRRIGIVSTRLAGTDGVSLEATKWQAVLERLGHTCFFFAGELDRPVERSRLVPEAFYRHPDIDAINAIAFAGSFEVTASADAEHPLIRRRDFFSPIVRPPHVSRRIDELRSHLKAELYRFSSAFDLELLIAENALAIPLNVPLGLAITEVVAETGIPLYFSPQDDPAAIAASALRWLDTDRVSGFSQRIRSTFDWRAIYHQRNAPLLGETQRFPAAKTTCSTVASSSCVACGECQSAVGRTTRPRPAAAAA